MLKWRLIAAAVILGPFLALIWLDDQHHGGRPGIWLGSLAVVVSVMAAQEMNHLLASAAMPVSRWVNMASVAVVTLSSLIPLSWPGANQGHIGRLGWTIVGTAAGVALLFIVELLRYREPGESIQRLAGGSLVVLYVGVLMGLLIQLRILLPGRMGLLAVISMVLIVKLADAGAFFVGRRWGRTKLTRVSPGKTLEGCLGGLLFAMAGAWWIQAELLPRWAPAYPVGSLIAFLAYGGSLMLAGLIGDLAESLLKRDAGQKDSSQWLPGLGGVLDIVDSLLAAAPLALIWWSSGRL